MNNSPSKERSAVLSIIYSTLYENADVDKLLEELRSSDIRINQVYNLIYGILRRHKMLSSYIDLKVSKKPPVEVYLIIELALYELSFNRSSKPYAVVSESLKLADHLGKGKYKPLINAIVRRFNDNIDKEFKILLKQVPFPDYIMKEIRKTFPDNIDAVVNGFLSMSPFFIVVNKNKISIEELMLRFSNKGINIENVKAFGVNGFRTFDSSILHSEEFKKGFFTIQDLSSQIAVNLLSPFEGMRMLDVCSAPGGKSMTSAMLSGDKAEILSIDRSSSRLVSFYENLNRMGLMSIKIMNEDILNYELPHDFFDRIIVDPPCTALGIIGRNPDAIFKKSARMSKDLSELQFSILIKVLESLKKDGKILYSVCTFTELETTDVIKRVLKERRDIKINGIPMNTIPNDLGMDGLFIAVMEKI